MKNYFNNHLKGSFSKEQIESVSSFLGEKYNDVRSLIEIIIPVVSIAILMKFKKHQTEDLLPHLTLTNTTKSILENDEDFRSVTVGSSDLQWGLIDQQKMNILFNQRFQEVVDYIGAFSGVKSKSVHQLFNLLWPKVFFGMGLTLESVPYKTDPATKLKADSDFFYNKLPKSFDINYVLGEIHYLKSNKNNAMIYWIIALLILAFIVYKILV